MKKLNKINCALRSFYKQKNQAKPSGFFKCKIHLKPLVILFLFLSIGEMGCKKIVSIDEPVNTVTTVEAFGTDAQANSTVAGIYAQMIENQLSFTNGMTTLYGGLSSDELIGYAGPGNRDDYEFQSDKLLSDEYIVQNFWKQAYFNIYQANAAILGLAASTNVHVATKNELTGEALFIRAYCYFYLINLFGDVPLVLTTDYSKTALLARTPKAQIYNQIISDLKSAQNLLENDYSYALAKGERVIPNKWAATALLARTYLYTNDYSDAYVQSNDIIGNSAFYSLDTLKGVFNANSSETIWQLKPNSSVSPFNVTEDGALFIPGGNGPQYYLTNSLMNSFEPNDLRKSTWISSENFGGTLYYYPYKYTLGFDQNVVGGPVPQYYMMLRLGEQYLIRAEAEANKAGGGISAALLDLNVIRNRAGLANYLGATDPTSVLNAIYHERQVELFAEWGHRWFDLKRLGNSNAISLLSANKGFTVSSNALLFPIPLNELKVDPNLTQNPGYQ